ncbi:MAG: AtpZ/AtpI family protein [Lachnospiraceae bacterium]|nr:AtpZ/AtpI family protein [Lachnospiraceae bacterium]
MQYKKSVFRSLAMVTQLGLSVVTPVFLCVFIGYQADVRFGTKILVPMLILGVLAGGRCAWGLAKNTMEQERREDEKLRRERMSRSTRAGVSKPKQPSRIRKEGGQQSMGEREADERWNG